MRLQKMKKGGVDTHYGKANILLQTYISRVKVDDFALASDTYYVSQNAGRILRGLFEIALSRNWGPAASVILSLCKSVDKRMWSFDHIMMQFDLPSDIIAKLDSIPDKMTVEHLREMDAKEIGQLIRNMRMGSLLLKCANHFPTLILDAQVAPITRTILRITLQITPGKTNSKYILTVLTSN
jgi:replicative superfamily II helicase